MKRTAPTISQDLLLDLVGCIYAAAGNHSLWNVFLSKFADAVGGTTTNIVVFDQEQANRSVAAAIRVDQESQRKYEEYYSTVDCWYNNGKKLLTTGNVVTGQMLCPDQVLERSEFYNDFLRPIDNFHEICGVISNDRSVASMITCMRPRRYGAFGIEETQLVRTLIPHLQRGVQLHRRLCDLENRAASTADALDKMAIGVVTTDASGKIVTMNRAAQAIADQRDGLGIVGQRLCAQHSNEAQRLRELIRDAGLPGTKDSHGSGGVMTVSRPSLRRALEILVGPLAPNCLSFVAKEAKVLVFITDTEIPVKSPRHVLAQVYGLTAAEERLASSLIQGKNLSQVAQEFRVTRNTLHSQLQSIFDKTGTNRQSELMRIFLKGLAQLRD
jgi:DNA-binding CsgD family transcriptional regulator/PAS domain-containing protein